MEHSKAFLQGRKGGGESAVPGGRCKRRLEAADMERAANDLYRGRAQGGGDWRLGESSGPGSRGASPSSAGCWGGCLLACLFINHHGWRQWRESPGHSRHCCFGMEGWRSAAADWTPGRGLLGVSPVVRAASEAESRLGAPGRPGFPFQCSAGRLGASRKQWNLALPGTWKTPSPTRQRHPLCYRIRMSMSRLSGLMKACRAAVRLTSSSKDHSSFACPSRARHAASSHRYE